MGYELPIYQQMGYTSTAGKKKSSINGGIFSEFKGKVIIPCTNSTALIGRPSSDR